MSNRRLALAFLFFAAPLFAQNNIKIHDQPDKAVYVTPAEWPVSNSQIHWDAAPLPDNPCHLHIRLRWPRRGELWFGFSTPVNFDLFHCAGYLSQVWSDHGFFVLDAYGTWKEYIHLNGNPNAIVTFPGRYYFEIARADGTLRAIPAHGATGVNVYGRMHLNDGTEFTQAHREPFWSMRNPAAPLAIETCDGCGLMLKTENSVNSAFDKMNIWGAAIVQTKDPLPIEPMGLGSVWNMKIEMFGYGTATGLTNTFIRWVDRDLHNGIPGRQLTSLFTLDTNEIGLGDHTIAFELTATVPATGLAGFTANEKASVIESFPITVVAGNELPPPPAPTCQDPAATNLGGPLPCLFPPPPLPVWTLGTVWTTGDPPVFKLCPGANPDAPGCVVP